MRFLTWSLAAALSVATWHLSPVANAQSQSPSLPALSDPSPSIPDKKLDAAAAAVERVASLQQDYREQMMAASPSDRKRLADEAGTALAKAVTDQGLSLDEYSTILQVAENNPEVREKILKRIRPSDK
jgi:Domain of unknown function (DUF4168)